ncbi:MAG: methyltransferase domain-containing protein [bacterium]|nr:methyltransferase domain-containing protein [bacterium]
MAIDVTAFTDVDSGDAPALIAYLDVCTRLARSRKPADYARQGIAPGMAVLDAGCGTGDDVRAIAELVGPAGRVAGVDSSRAMILAARQRGLPPNAEVRLAPAHAVPYPDRAFDLVRAERLFQHLAQPDAAARELLRVLKPGGAITILDQDWQTMDVGGADPELSGRIAGAFASSLANGRAGALHGAVLQRAGFREIESCATRTTLPLGPAYALVLSTAVETAKLSGALSAAQAEEWIASLLAANRRGAFSFAVTMHATHARVGATSRPGCS